MLNNYFLNVLKSMTGMLVLNLACGRTETDRTQSYTSIPVQLFKAPESTGSTNLNLKELNLDDLELIAPSSYTMLIEGCVSGYSATLSQTTTIVNILKSDSKCLVELTEFSYNGATYQPKSDSEFSTYAVGDSAIFVNQDNPNDMFYVKVNSQLSSPVLSSDNVSYIFGVVPNNEGTSTDTTKNSSKSQTYPISSQNIPNFNLDSKKPLATLFSGLDDDSAGLFQFKLMCNFPMTNGSADYTFCPTLAKSTTQGCDLSDITYKLVKDTYGIRNGNALTEEEIQGIFKTSGTPVIAPGDQIGKSSTSKNNKGFKTRVLTGPAPMESNLYMLLILNCKNLSYQYFPIVAPTITE